MRCATLLVLILCAPAVVLASDEQPTDPDRLGELVFSDLYAHEFRAAVQLGGREKLDLARRMLTRAELWDGNRTFVLLHYRKAYELSQNHAGSYDIALTAMRRQAERFPDTRVECLERIADVQRRIVARDGSSRRASQEFLATLEELSESFEHQGNPARAAMFARHAEQHARRIDSDRADALSRRVRDLTVLTNVARRDEALLRRLREDHADADVRRQLVMLRVTERDDPASAEQLLNEDVDADLRRRVRLAAEAQSQLDARDAHELSRWYEDLSDGGSGLARRRMRLRAEHYRRRASGGPLAAAGRER